MAFLWVALGGGLGAMGRYAISLIPFRGSFPFLTLITNIIGAIVIGFIAGIAASRKDISPGLILFTKTGICGGFTTFSTFSLEAYQLFDAHRFFPGVIYLLLSVAGCLCGIYCGMRIASRVNAT